MDEKSRFSTVQLSSKRHDYTTPMEFFDKLDRIFSFQLDAAASDENTLCPDYFTPAEDALNQKWHGITWCNPPYGRQLPRFVKHAAEQAQLGTTSVLLIPARPDRHWWFDWIWKTNQRWTFDGAWKQDGYGYVADVCFLRGRLRFGTEKNDAPFPSALIVFSRHGIEKSTKAELERLMIGHWIWDITSSNV